MSTNDPDQMLTEQDLNRLQLTTLQYYLHESNPANGLIRDKTEKSAPASIAAVGLALASLPIFVERGVVSREFAPELALKRLRFFRDSPHGPEPDATGYKGFYYHFLDMKSGRRVWNCELSTIDSAFLFAGMLTCAAYFDADTAVTSAAISNGGHRPGGACRLPFHGRPGRGARDRTGRR
jgi:hypothetical protein